MASSATTVPTAAPSMTSKSSSKQGKTKIAKLRLSPAQLAKFPSTQVSSMPSQPKSASSAASAPSDPTNEASPSANASDSNAAATPAAAAASSLLAPPSNPLVKRKGVPGPKPGMKRTNSQLNIDGPPKPRGKPGPKKKPRVGENGAILNGAATPAAPKLGPKANQGAINACLRALDRTGKPCRKWEKRGFKVKSFTGTAWAAATWSANKKAVADFLGDVKSDSSSSGENKPTQESSVVPSEKSNSGGDTSTPSQLADLISSPAPFVAVNPA